MSTENIEAPAAPDLRDRMAKVLDDHTDYCFYGDHDGDCSGEGCDFKSKAGGRYQEQLAGHQADVLLPIIEEHIATQTADLRAARDGGETILRALIYDADRLAFTRLHRAEAAVARIRARHQPVRRERHPYREYCAVCFTNGGMDGALPVRYPCPEIQALEGDDE